MNNHVCHFLFIDINTTCFKSLKALCETWSPMQASEVLRLWKLSRLSCVHTRLFVCMCDFMIQCKPFLIQPLLQNKGYLFLVICPFKSMCLMVSYNLHDLVLMPKGRLSPCGFWVQRIRATNLWNLFRGREGAEEHNGEGRWLVSLSKKLETG